MFNAILLMLLTGLIWTGVGVVFGAAPSEKNRLYSFFSLYGILVSAFVWIVRTPSAAPAGEILRLAALMLPSAAMEVAAFFFLKLAMDRGNQGIAWSVAQSSMVVSFLCSIAFLHNPSTPAQWAGLALVLAGLALFGRDKSAGSGSNDGLYARYVIAAFALLGVGQFLRLIPGSAGFSTETLTWRLPLQMSVGMVFWTSLCAAKRTWRAREVWKASLVYAIVVALGQICFYLAADAADALRITSIVMPVTIGTCILLFALWCRFFRGERLSRGGWTAVALDIAGIALLSCP